MAEHPNKPNKWILIGAGLFGGAIGLTYFMVSNSFLPKSILIAAIPYLITLGVLGLMTYNYFTLEADHPRKSKIKLLIILIAILLVLKIIASVYSHYYD